MCCQRRVMCACMPVANCFRNGVFKSMVFDTNLPHKVRTKTKGRKKQQQNQQTQRTHKKNENENETKHERNKKTKKQKQNKHNKNWAHCPPAQGIRASVHQDLPLTAV